MLAGSRECKPTVVTSASPCVDDEALFALARGELAAADLASVEGHLQDCADCRAVLAEAARALEPPPTASRPGGGGGPVRIARYEVEALLGAGAAGVVYRGFDPQLKRAVALKLLRPELRSASPEQSERLLREAQAMARLSDPHVVTVYDVGLHQGMVYLVMEYVDGHTLSQWLREAPRTVAEILRVFGDAGRGLVAAHQKGLVHRDFKPENVLVARDGRARVTDFGLARESESWLGDRRADDQASTALYAPTRGLVGTPAYMAPELFEGGVASPASDQFAFAVALFVALFEKHPFRAGEGIALSELVARVTSGTLEVPALTSRKSERLFNVLRRALAASPSARFADVRELLVSLERAAGSRRGGALAATAALVVLVTGVAASRETGSGRLPLPRPADRAVSAAAGAVTSPDALPAARPSTVLPDGSSGRPIGVPSVAPSARRLAPPPAGSGAEKRRAPRAVDVRYKDWLKDPF